MLDEFNAGVLLFPKLQVAVNGCRDNEFSPRMTFVSSKRKDQEK